MPADYLRNLLLQRTAFTGPQSPAAIAAGSMVPVLNNWGKSVIDSITYSGSYAKGTAVQGGTDVDLFISLKTDFNWTLEQIHTNLLEYLKAQGYRDARAQNVSIGLTVGQMKVDLVPGKKQQLQGTDHSLYRRKGNTWTKTNVQTHIQTVVNSGRQSEIRLMKLWRNQKGLNFPSFYLELSVIAALQRHTLLGMGGDFTAHIVKVLQYLSTTFLTARIIDPANTNNVISDDLSEAEKETIARYATAALGGNWQGFIS